MALSELRGQGHPAGAGATLDIAANYDTLARRWRKAAASIFPHPSVSLRSRSLAINQLSWGSVLCRAEHTKMVFEDTLAQDLQRKYKTGRRNI